MRLFRLVGLLVIAVSLTACVSPEAERQKAIKTASDHCIAEGKQFILKDVQQHGVANITHFDTMVAGYCVGPGDPRYVPPAKDQKASPPAAPREVQPKWE